jgi:hypothetical protein
VMDRRETPEVAKRDKILIVRKGWCVWYEEESKGWILKKRILIIFCFPLYRRAAERRLKILRFVEDR